MAPSGGRLASILEQGAFCVTGEVVPPRSGDASTLVDQARGLVGYVDAVNVTDNPAASAHMSPLAGVRFAAAAGIEPTLQLTCRDRNRLALTSDLLGAWALGARNLLCLSGDPITVGDQPEAAVVNDLSVLELIAVAVAMRDKGRAPSGLELPGAPRFLVGVAEMPLADPYDPSRLEAKLNAGADVVWTQIAYDLDKLSAWADNVRPLGFFERAKVIVGVVPLRGAKAARAMDEKLPGVSVPASVLAQLDEAGPDASEVGLGLTVDLVKGLQQISGISGVHLMGMGHDDAVRSVVERSGLFPRPVGLS
jgi:methylenetetrahydrofolate reductase (NADPH)